MLLETKLIIGVFFLLGAGLSFAVTKVLGTWAEHHISRHDLVVESRRRRLEYFNAIAERQNASMEDNASVTVEEDDADAPYARAA